LLGKDSLISKAETREGQRSLRHLLWKFCKGFGSLLYSKNKIIKELVAIRDPQGHINLTKKEMEYYFSLAKNTLKRLKELDKIYQKQYALIAKYGEDDTIYDEYLNLVRLEEKKRKSMKYCIANNSTIRITAEQHIAEIKREVLAKRITDNVISIAAAGLLGIAVLYYSEISNTISGIISDSKRMQSYLDHAIRFGKAIAFIAFGLLGPAIVSSIIFKNKHMERLLDKLAKKMIDKTEK